MTTYEPTEQDIQDYNLDQAKLSTEPYILATGDVRSGQEKVVARKLKNGQWLVTYCGAMALNMAEPIGRTANREEAIKIADGFATRQGWKLS